MKIGKKLFIENFIVLIFIIIFCTIIITFLFNISKNTKVIEQTAILSEGILDFNVENFHTQLELWEYAYDPNQERLEAFEKHKDTLEHIFLKINEAKKYNEQSGNFIAIDEQKFSEISKDFRNLVNGWNSLIQEIYAFQIAKEANKSEEELGRIEKTLRIKFIENELYFDNLMFNEKMDDLTLSQKILIGKRIEQQNKKIESFRSLLIMIIILSVLIGATITIINSYTITKSLKKLTKVISDISLGKMDVEIDPILKESGDEIGDLARAFERTIVSLKLAISKGKKKE